MFYWNSSGYVLFIINLIINFKNMEKIYNVYIIECETGKASAKIGSNLNERQANKRVMTGLMRINDNFFVGDYEVGSETDKRLEQDLLNK